MCELFGYHFLRGSAVYDIASPVTAPHKLKQFSLFVAATHPGRLVRCKQIDYCSPTEILFQNVKNSNPGRYRYVK